MFEDILPKLSLLAADWKELGLIPGESGGFPFIVSTSRVTQPPIQWVLKLPGGKGSQSLVLTTTLPSHVKVKETAQPCFHCPSVLQCLVNGTPLALPKLSGAKVFSN